MRNNHSSKDFNMMVLGQIISVFGSALLRFALSLYILDITGRADLFATMYAVSNIPLLLAPLGGAVADRFNRRNLMVIFDFTSSAIVLCLYLFIATDNSSVLLIGIIMVLLSAVSALYTPAVTASIPLLVEEKKLEGANGIVQAVQALSGIAAPIIGGVIYGLLGIGNLVIISGIAFFLSAVMEIFIKIPYVKREQDKNIAATIAGDMKYGFLYVIKQPFILKSMILAALLNFLLTPFFVVGGPIILRVTMQSSDTMYGIGMGLIQLATILGALSIGFFAPKMRINGLYRWQIVISGLFLPIALSLTPLMLNTGYYPSFVLFTVCAIPIAMALTIISIFIITKVQKMTPDENLGKVMAIIMAVAQCAAPVGQVLYGVIFETFNTAVYIPTLIVSAVMLIMSAATKRILRNETDRKMKENGGGLCITD